MILVHYLFSESCCLRHFMEFPSIDEQCRYEIIVEIFGYYSWNEFEFVVLNQDLYTELFEEIKQLFSTPQQSRKIDEGKRMTFEKIMYKIDTLLVPDGEKLPHRFFIYMNLGNFDLWCK